MYDYITEEESNDPLFYFNTSLNYTFEVRLTKYPNDIDDFKETFSISVDCLNEDSPKKDASVGQTICHILSEFLSNNNSSLLMYVCDLEDRKAQLRQRKFSGWHNMYSDGTYELSKFEVDILNSDLKYYSAIVFDPTIHSNELISSTFNSEVAYMNAYK